MRPVDTRTLCVRKIPFYQKGAGNPDDDKPVITAFDRRACNGGTYTTNCGRTFATAATGRRSLLGMPRPPHIPRRRFFFLYPPFYFVFVRSHPHVGQGPTVPSHPRGVPLIEKRLFLSHNPPDPTEGLGSLFMFPFHVS